MKFFQKELQLKSYKRAVIFYEKTEKQHKQIAIRLIMYFILDGLH